MFFCSLFYDSQVYYHFFSSCQNFFSTKTKKVLIEKNKQKNNRVCKNPIFLIPPLCLLNLVYFLAFLFRNPSCFFSGISLFGGSLLFFISTFFASGHNFLHKVLCFCFYSLRCCRFGFSIFRCNCFCSWLWRNRSNIIFCITVA